MGRAWTIPFVLAAGLVVPSATARALGLDAGAGMTESIGLVAGDHLGFYVTGAASVYGDAGPWAFGTSFGASVAPDTARWGFFGSLDGDYALTPWLGLDLSLLVVHDQLGAQWGYASFFAGAGTGVSFFLDTWTISPNVTILRDLFAEDYALGLGLHVAKTLVHTPDPLDAASADGEERR